MSSLQSQIVTANPAAAELNAMLRWARPYEMEIYRVALALTGDREGADRVLASTVLSAWADLVRPRNTNPSLLEVLRIAVSESLAILRLRAGDLAGWIDEPETELGRMDVTALEWESDPSKCFAPREWRRIRELALESLVPLDRVVFVLRDIFRFSLEDSSILTGRSEAAVKVRLVRARLRLREWLNPLCRVQQKEVEVA